jgi:excisionase family DNA binding protein
VSHALTRAEILAAWQAAQRLVSINDAATYCGVNPRTIRRRIADGSITGYTVGKKLVRVDLNEIDERLLQRIPTVTAG